MSEARHTPAISLFQLHEDRDGFLYFKEAESNCRLAAAAPDLLEALKVFAKLPLPEDGDGTPRMRDGQVLTYPLLQADIRAARAAIARAQPQPAEVGE